MTEGRPQGGQSAANTGAVRRAVPWMGAALVAAVALLTGLAAPARALVITGGPVYALPGGGTCTLSALASAVGGGTWTCSGVNTSAHTHVYFGMKVNTDANGNTMNGAAPSGGSVFTTVTGTTPTQITYDNSTTTVADQIHGSQTATNTLILTIGGTNPGTVIATGGTPAGNGNGGIIDLFSLPTGLASASFTVNAQINASTPVVANGAALTTYANSHATNSVAEVSKVDLAFYYSDCGDGVVDSPEACDQGSAVNGTPGSCCSATCQFKTNGTSCTGNVRARTTPSWTAS